MADTKVEVTPESGPLLGIEETRRNVVIRALEFAAHGHGELPSGFMSDAVDCLTGVLRDSENQLIAAEHAGSQGMRQQMSDGVTRATLVAMAQAIRDKAQPPDGYNVVVVVTDPDGDWCGVSSTADDAYTARLLFAALHGADMRKHMVNAESKEGGKTK